MASSHDAGVVAVDWSGARATSGQRRAIWLAEIAGGAWVRVRSGLTRGEVAAELTELRDQRRSLVVGLDFGFSFPRTALEVLDVADGPALWDLAADRGESWMDGTDVADAYPLADVMDGPGHLRRTEVALTDGGLAPRSTIDLRVRTGNVGRQSVRGFPVLRDLRGAGFAIWPFDEPADHVVVEIYPRLLRRHVPGADGRDPDRGTVRAALDRDEEVPDWVAELARGDDDAFDAVVGALALHRHYDRTLLPATDAIDTAEGRIWRPPA